MKSKFSSIIFLTVVLISCQKSGDSKTVVSFTPATDSIKPLVLWNGESQPVGVGWVSPLDSDMNIEIEHTIVYSANTAIRIHMSHPNTFLEAGWQWSNWTNTQETNFKLFKTFRISVRVDGPLPSDDLQLSLASPGDHHDTQRISMKHYEANLMDGTWHNLAIPLNDFYSKDMKFDPEHAIQIIIGSWNNNGNFMIYLDDILLN